MPDPIFLTWEHTASIKWKKQTQITNLKCKLKAHILKSFKILTHALALKSASCKHSEDILQSPEELHLNESWYTGILVSG